MLADTTFPDPQYLPPCLARLRRAFSVGGCTFYTLPLGQGEYRMGDDDSRFDFEKPAHPVHIRYDVEIGCHPVTQALWQAVMGENPAYFPGDDRPVEEVSWDDIRISKDSKDGFLKRLNELVSTAEGQHPPGHFRLPSEAEWEYAARGGSLGRWFAHPYAGSRHLPEVGWYSANNANSQRETQALGRKMPSPTGLHDLSGNVWEWVEDDWHDKYEKPPDDRSAWIDQPKRGSSRVVRGGSWDFDAGRARVASRSGYHPGHRFRSIGFRVAFVPQSVG